MSGAPPPQALANGQKSQKPPRPKPNANPLRPMRRRGANPLVASKRAPSTRRSGPPIQNHQSNPLGLDHASTVKSAQELEKRRKQFNGWSDPKPDNCAEYSVVTTKKALRESIRHHIMRFYRTGSGDQEATDPTDQQTFTRPVTLHRRDPRQPPPGRVVTRSEVAEEPLEPRQVDEKEVERQAAIKAEREAQRALDQAKIAPTVKDGVPKKPKKPKEEKIHFNRKPRTEQAQKEADLKYEEALPWHLEDVDGRNVWVGSYVSALSETNVAFVIDGKNFRMVPLEKWYRFTAKAAFERIPEDQVEEYMRKQSRPSRWMMQMTEKREEERKVRTEYRNQGRRAGRPVGVDGGQVRGYDEIDMEGEEFDDDDEGPAYEVDDEDAKISTERIRQNQLGANLFGDADEHEVDAVAEQEMRRDRERKAATKKLKKVSVKREGVDEMESDTDESNPFESSSSENESEEEEDQTQGKPEDEDKAAGPAVPTKGSGTPTGKQREKGSDGSKKIKTLKRAGSPGLSESSGNESTRKKVKTATTASASARQSRSSTPIPGSQAQAAGQRRKLGPGSLSDGEATGGEMSDGQPKKKKIKVVPSGGRGTPTGSRPASPLPAARAASPAAASPAREGQAGEKPAIEAWEIVDALPPPPAGLAIGAFLKMFSDRVGDTPGKMPKHELIALIRQNAQYGADKLLRRKPLRGA